METITKQIGGVDWMMTSPPYDNAMPILQTARSCCRVGVAFKMSNALLEPTRSRDDNRWLQDNPPNKIIFLTRQTYKKPKRAGTHCMRIGEFWGVWYTNQQTAKTGTELSWARA
jgi:hypothetical protein